jgi:hypothetical protein
MMQLVQHGEWWRMESSKKGRSRSDGVGASLVRALHGVSLFWLLQEAAAECL